MIHSNNFSRYAIYFEDLRRRLFLLTKIFIIFFVFGFVLASPAIKYILDKININDVTIITTGPFQLIQLMMSFAFLFACMIIIPIFIYHLYSFLKSGLLASEKKLFFISLPLSLLLFTTGFFYGAGMLYYGVKVIAKANVILGIGNYWDISIFVSQIIMTSSLLGLLFLFPIVIHFLIKLKIIDINFLKTKRKHAIVAIFILVSLLPPTDGLSLILMALPLLLIFELTILFNRNKKMVANYY
jgi:sec-independent protein translocase protein TatC